MPEVILLPIEMAEVLRKYQRQRTRFRSEGIHLSDIVSRIVKDVEPGRFGDGPIDPTLAHQGFIWEDALSAGFASQFSLRQMEGELDGILMTLDGHRRPGAPSVLGIPPSKKGRVLEAKSTKISAEHTLSSRKFWHWMLRTVGYCKLMETDEAEFIVFYVNGSYELGGGRFGAPTAKAFLVRFSKVEMQQGWDWIRFKRDEMLEEIESGGGEDEDDE